VAGERTARPLREIHATRSRYGVAFTDIDKTSREQLKCVRIAAWTFGPTQQT
jgi:hypothetical protein